VQATPQIACYGVLKKDLPLFQKLLSPFPRKWQVFYHFEGKINGIEEAHIVRSRVSFVIYTYIVQVFAVKEP
jgi:hypothetical protein